MSFDNLLTYCNNNIRSCLKGSAATIISVHTFARKEHKHFVKRSSVDLHQERISLNNSKKVNRLAYYFQRYITRDRRRCENSKHESRATNYILLLFDFYISLPSSLSCGARSNSFLAFTSLYLVVVS